MRAVVVAGAGRYADPWHDFAGTSARLAAELTSRGLDATVATLGEAQVPAAVDLLVVNAGGGSNPRDVDGSAADLRAEELADWVRAQTADGVPTLVTHTGSNTFYDDERWEHLVGGRWVPGTSWHPPLAPTQVQLTAVEHPVTAGLPAQLEVVDERYCDLRVADEASVLVDHAQDGRRHPIVWVHEAGGVRVVHDALGHDVAAYDGADRRALLDRELDWLLGR